MASVPQETISTTRVLWVRVQKWAARSRSWISILLLTPALVGALLSAPWFFAGSWGNCFFDMVGWLLFFSGATMRWWSTLYIGGRKTTSLVIDGPYSICRNPIYVGTLLMTAAVAAFLQSLTFLLCLALAMFIYLSTTVPVEERRLRERYGRQFDEYCVRVPRFIPNFRQFNSPNAIEINIGGLASEGYRALRWIWLPILCEVVTQLRVQPNWPHLLRLP
jgi:protein-S-isoprenylcysteine O-methyltransferase Ste14